MGSQCISKEKRREKNYEDVTDHEKLLYHLEFLTEDETCLGALNVPSSHYQYELNFQLKILHSFARSYADLRMASSCYYCVQLIKLAEADGRQTYVLHILATKVYEWTFA